MVETRFLIVACSILFVVIVLMYFCSLFFIRMHQKEVDKLTRYQINAMSNIDISIPELLDGFIDRCFDDYKILTLIPLNESYITEEREKEIRDGLTDVVVNRISPNLIDKISMYYNMESIDSMGNVLSDKIYITVLDYTLEHNRIVGNAENVQSLPNASK